jgi:hypothetical protein
MTYVKIAFVLNEGEPPVAWWVQANTSNLATAFYNSVNLCQGYWVRSGLKPEVLTVTSEEPAEDVLTLQEVRDRVEAAVAVQEQSDGA